MHIKRKLHEKLNFQKNTVPVEYARTKIKQKEICTSKKTERHVWDNPAWF